MTRFGSPERCAVESRPIARDRPRAATAATWTRRAAAVLTAWTLLGSGCSLLPTAPAEDVALHLLDARPAVPTAARREQVLAVSPPRAAAGADSVAIAYLQKAHALEHYATHRWADTPARMLAPLLARALDDTGTFRSVVQAGSGIQADLRLDTEIVQLRQSFLGKPSRIEFTLRAQLVDVPGRRVLAARYVEVVQDAPSDDAAGGVAAANTAVERALAEVAAFCIEAAVEVRPRAPSAPSSAGSAARP